MIIFCKTCRSGLVREEQIWRHRDGEPADAHAARPIAARRCHLFDPEVVGLPGYDQVLVRLVERERAAGSPTEAWRIGLYVFDGRVRGIFRYVAQADKVPANSPLQPPKKATRSLLRSHPIVKERLGRQAPRV